ncbi:hypothetical protein [Pseudarthrobacter equi]|uniref:hypothetical protein n=1 Tax=Pseudarthrobacter equi TaxID=728066 RepID=UPI000B32E342|nr:hypothetical protein [Pseudarthrobacter equi]
MDCSPAQLLHDADGKKMFDAVIVISDRKVLDGQLQDAVKQLNKVDGYLKPLPPLRRKVEGTFQGTSWWHPNYWCDAPDLPLRS